MSTVKLGVAGWILLAIVNVFLWLPLLVIAVLAFSDANSITFPPPAYSLRWLSTLVTDDVWRRAIETSAFIGLASTALSLLLGVPLALGLSRGAIGRFTAVQGAVVAPLILPGISLAIGFYFVAAWTRLLGTSVPLIVAHTTVGISYVVVTVLAADRSLDKSLEPAARTLGASFLRAIADVTLPLVSVGIIGGAVLAFLHSWDDVVNALMLGSARVRTFPFHLWNEMQHVLIPIAATAAMLLSVVSISVLALAGLLLVVRRKQMPANLAESVVLRKGME